MVPAAQAIPNRLALPRPSRRARREIEPLSNAMSSVIILSIHGRTPEKETHYFCRKRNRVACTQTKKELHAAHPPALEPQPTEPPLPGRTNNYPIVEPFVRLWCNDGSGMPKWVRLRTDRTPHRRVSAIQFPCSRFR